MTNTIWDWYIWNFFLMMFEAILGFLVWASCLCERLHKVDANFVVAYMKWNVDSTQIPNEVSIRTFLHHTSIWVDEFGVYLYFNPPSQLDKLI